MAPNMWLTARFDSFIENRWTALPVEARVIT